ncbi:MAG: hypothetical protein WAW96_14485 [Alphaproteobacteria bacterium]
MLDEVGIVARRQEASGADVWYEPGAYEDSMGPLGAKALYTVMALAEDTPMRADGERRWFVSDHDTLAVSMGLEEQVRSGGLSPEAPAEVRDEVTGYLDAWHAALPFNESEREIVRNAYHASLIGSLAYREIPTQLRKADFEVMASGVQTVVRGRDLMRRWWAWRRELDEFEGQDSVSHAKEAAAQLAGRLILPDRMPEIYYDLRNSG